MTAARSRLAVLIRATVAAAARGLAWVLLPPVYLLWFVPLRLWRAARGARDPLELAFPGPPGSLWRTRPPPGGPDAARRMH